MSVREVELQRRQAEAEKLAATLRRLRLEARMTIQHLARKTGIDRSRISRFEGAYQVPSPDDVELILRGCRVQEENGEDVRALVRDLHHKSVTHHLVTPSPTHHMQDGVAALEAAATKVRYFEANFVPGQLQTAAYARAVIAHDITWPIDDVTRNQATCARAARQQTLFQTHRNFTFLVSVRALRARHLGGELLQAQCNHLISLGSLEHVQIGLISDADTLAAEGNGFAIFDEDLVFTDTLFGHLRSTDRAVIDRCKWLFSELSERASWGKDAVRLLEQLQDELGRDRMT